MLSRLPSEETRERLNRLAWLLDSSIPLPGTRFTIGLEALIGLVPVVGDLIGVALSSYILHEARTLGVSRAVLLRMALNVAVEGIVGLVPFAGDVFDAAFKANQRNVRLLNEWVERPDKSERASRAFVAWVIGGLIALFVVIAALTVGLIRLIWPG
jgi:cobalamin synthase